MLEDRAIAASGGGTGQIRSWSQEGAVSCRVFAGTVGCANMRNGAVGNHFFR